MGLFKKEPDMKCWDCDKFISQKKVKWHPRKVGSPDGNIVVTESLREIEKMMGNKESIASPNKIFGLHEYEYRGQCPECKSELTAFWFGWDSLKRNGKKEFYQKPFNCNNCDELIERTQYFWYSSKFAENEKITEYLIMVCPKCHTEQGYPYRYDLEKGIIE